MHIHSFNEWDTLKEIIVGEASYANWPINDPVFAKESEKTSWKETPVPSGPVPQHIIDETNEDLETLCHILQSNNVIIHRPAKINFQELDGMYNYCPRDRFLIAGNVIVDPAMMYPCRDLEIQALHYLVDSAPYKFMPRHEGMTLDAANVCRLGDTWLYLESWSGNREAYNWLNEQFPDINIELVNFYSGVHIDSTIVPLNSNTVMINAERVKPHQVPNAFEDWHIIWIYDHNIVEQDFYEYPYASKWIGMNTLSINPETVIVERSQKHIIKILESAGFTVIPCPLRHSRTLGGGFHCVTLDTWRESEN